MDVETRLAAVVQTVLRQEAGGQDREQCIVFNSETKRRNYCRRRLWTQYTEEFKLTGRNKIWTLVTG